MALNPWQMAGLGGAGAGLAYSGMNMKNPADAASPYFDQIPGVMKPYYDPYIQSGQNAIGNLQGEYGSLLGGREGLQGQYSNMMKDPGAVVNRIGEGYHQSPGFQFALNQALQGAGHAAAAGGLAGSPEHEQQNMGLATNLANQDYNTWLQNAMGMYGAGLQGEQGMYNQGLTGEQGLGAMGYGSSNELAQSLANAMMSRGSLAFQGQQQQNKNQGDVFSNIAGLAALAAFA